MQETGEHGPATFGPWLHPPGCWNIPLFRGKVHIPCDLRISKKRVINFASCSIWLKSICRFTIHENLFSTGNKINWWSDRLGNFRTVATQESLGELLKIPVPRFHMMPLESENIWWQAKTLLCFNSRWLLCVAKFESLDFRTYNLEGKEMSEIKWDMTFDRLHQVHW